MPRPSLVVVLAVVLCATSLASTNATPAWRVKDSFGKGGEGDIWDMPADAIEGVWCFSVGKKCSETSPQLSTDGIAKACETTYGQCQAPWGTKDIFYDYSTFCSEGCALSAWASMLQCKGVRLRESVDSEWIDITPASLAQYLGKVKRLSTHNAFNELFGLPCSDYLSHELVFEGKKTAIDSLEFWKHDGSISEETQKELRTFSTECLAKPNHMPWAATQYYATRYGDERRGKSVDQRKFIHFVVPVDSDAPRASALAPAVLPAQCNKEQMIKCQKWASDEGIKHFRFNPTGIPSASFGSDESCCQKENKCYPKMCGKTNAESVCNNLLGGPGKFSFVPNGNAIHTMGSIGSCCFKNDVSRDAGVGSAVGKLFGEAHVETFDNQDFDFVKGVKDNRYWLVKTSGHVSFEFVMDIQADIHTEEVPGKPGVMVGRVDAVYVRSDSGTVVQIVRNAAEGDNPAPIVNVNEFKMDHASIDDEEVSHEEGGFRVQQAVERDESGGSKPAVAKWKSVTRITPIGLPGVSVVVTTWAGDAGLDVECTLTKQYNKMKISGLFGNFNGNNVDDVTDANGKATSMSDSGWPQFVEKNAVTGSDKIPAVVGDQTKPSVQENAGVIALQLTEKSLGAAVEPQTTVVRVRVEHAVADPVEKELPSEIQSQVAQEAHVEEKGKEVKEGNAACAGMSGFEYYSCLWDSVTGGSEVAKNDNEFLHEKSQCTNDCSGHGMCEACGCVCDDGWMGASCGEELKLEIAKIYHKAPHTFNGDMMHVPCDKMPTPFQHMTVMGWFKLDAESLQHEAQIPLFFRGNLQETPSVWVGGGEEPLIYAGLTTKSGKHKVLKASCSLKGGSWVHIAYKLSPHAMVLYVDGRFAGELSLGCSAEPLLSTEPLVVGGFHGQAFAVSFTNHNVHRSTIVEDAKVAPVDAQTDVKQIRPKKRHGAQIQLGPM